MARDFLGNIKGPQGPKGDDGARGPKGDKGDKGESESPYIVDSGESITNNGAHFYEVYKTGFAKAWGYVIRRGVNFNTEMTNGNYRSSLNFVITPIIDFDDETVSAIFFVDGRSDEQNIQVMSPINRGIYNARLVMQDVKPYEEVDVYISYIFNGKPI